MTDSIDTSADILDVRDIIARFEELEAIYDSLLVDEAESVASGDWKLEDPEGREFCELSDWLDSLRGADGDEQWRGDWYPVTLIARSYFVDYCEDMLKDIGNLPDNLPAYLVIDMEATAKNLEVDYSSIELDGNEFLYR